MTDVAPVSLQGAHACLVAAGDPVLPPLLVGGQPAQETRCSSERLAAVSPIPLSTRAVCETGDSHVKGCPILLLDHRERAGELTVVTELHDDHPSKLRDH